jgi:4-hydroxyphenylacetate 3-monooxygenase
MTGQQISQAKGRAMKTGADHIKSLRDRRMVYVHGQLVEDVVDHPAYRNAVRSVAHLYDFQAAPENLERMTFVSPTSGDRVNRCWQLPHSYEELRQRREALSAWAECTYGFMGRSPDHVASCLSGMVMGIEIFERHSKERARALWDYFTYARDHDLFVTYTIVNPQADRAKGASEQADAFLAAAICDEDTEGITIRGGKMLGTSTIMANEVLVTSIQPLRPDEEPYAFTAAVPLAAEGLKILSRKSYEAAAVSEFDNPLATHFDENDAVLYFDEVKIPWERVFVYRDPDMCRAQFHDTPTHVYQNYQAQIRLMVKMRFFLGLARKIAEVNGILTFAQVVETLGLLAAQVSMVEGMVYGMEAAGTQWGAYFVPNRRMLYAALVLTQQLYPQVIHTLRELAGGGMIMLPSSVADFANPDIAAYIRKTQQSPAVHAEERVKLFKLAWDAVGSEFASRHTQYEMFYASAAFVTRGHAFRTCDWPTATGLVDACMQRYDLPGV